MSLDGNLDDLRRHAADFGARTGFTSTVLDPVTGDVIGCVYLYYPSQSPDADVTAQSWARSSHAELDVPLADVIAAWLAAECRGSACTAPAAERHPMGDGAYDSPTDTNEAVSSALLRSRITIGPRSNGRSDARALFRA